MINRTCLLYSWVKRNVSRTCTVSVSCIKTNQDFYLAQQRRVNAIKNSAVALQAAEATKNSLCLLWLHFPFCFMCCFHLCCLDKNNNQLSFPQIEEITVTSHIQHWPFHLLGHTSPWLSVFRMPLLSSGSRDVSISYSGAMPTQRLQT